MMASNSGTAAQGRRGRRARHGRPAGPALPLPAIVALFPVPLSLVLLSLAACEAGSGSGLDVSGRPLSEGGDVPLAATLESIQANVFNAECTVCHAGAAAPLGLRLDAANSYTNLVGVPSRQVGSLLRVEPGDPDASYLVRKLEGSAAEGGRMPLGGAPIPDTTIAFVRQWIADGAPADSPGPGAAPVIVSLDPAPGSSGAGLPPEIAVGFDQDVDASTVNGMTFILQRSGGDGAFDDGNDVDLTPAGVALSSANARLVLVDLAGVSPTVDTYRITVRGSGPNVVLSVDGRALDGEFTGTFPTGDGTEGGDFAATFSIEGLQPTLDSIQANLFTPTCAVAGCHTGPTGPDLPAGMDLSSADASFASLVDVASLQDASRVRVVPGDADASWLIEKLEGTATVGGQMPFGQMPLDAATIEVVRAWIDAGAER